MNVKRIVSIGSLIVFVVAVAWAGTLFAQGPGGGGGRGWQGNSSGMGPGMMGQGWGSGYGMGPGMMGQGSGMGPGMMGQGYGPQGYGQQYQQPQMPISKSDAESMMRNYVSRNPNLKMGRVQDGGNSFEADVTTKDGSIVNKLFVDKDTGRIRSEY
jgi:hypothetical protein